MADWRTLNCLRTVLVEVIYPKDMALCRNDAKAAKRVHDYVFSVEEEYLRERNESWIGRGRVDRDSYERDYLRVEPLVGMSQQSIRKYVALVWRDMDLAKSLKFKENDGYKSYTGLI